jgi:hypothetical protein
MATPTLENSLAMIGSGMITICSKNWQFSCENGDFLCLYSESKLTFFCQFCGENIYKIRSYVESILSYSSPNSLRKLILEILADKGVHIKIRQKRFHNIRLRHPKLTMARRRRRGRDPSARWHAGSQPHREDGPEARHPRDPPKLLPASAAGAASRSADSPGVDFMNQFMPEFPGKPLLGSNILFRNNV